jgi:rhamnogalacturonyl hydrolase YesR
LQEKGRGHLYLDGWAGSGKSVALYSLVAWARAQGWLALYVPSAFSMVQSE